MLNAMGGGQCEAGRLPQLATDIFASM